MIAKSGWQGYDPELKYVMFAKPLKQYQAQ